MDRVEQDRRKDRDGSSDRYLIDGSLNDSNPQNYLSRDARPCKKGMAPGVLWNFEREGQECSKGLRTSEC